jgi:L-rhamnonate dehydratase
MNDSVKELGSTAVIPRRDFLQSAGLSAGAAYAGAFVPKQSHSEGTVSQSGASGNSGERIKEVRAFTIERGVYDESDKSKEEDVWTRTTLISSPMAVYPEYHDDRRSWGMGVLGSVIVEIEDGAGRTGIGISSCGVPGAYIIEQHFKRFIVGSYPWETERIWDQLWRSSLHYGRKGLPIMAISAVDLALWDLLGKQRQEPVYALIGGQVRSEIHMYATTPNAEYAKQMGFWGAKMALPYGPADGREGLRRNVQMAEEARGKVGRDFDLMFDCWMSLDVPYTVDLAKALEPARIRWLEECLPPDDYDGLVDVRNAVKSCWLTTGEHEYTRYGFLEILKRRCVDILQPDLTWCGGLTEAIKIAHMAKAYNVRIVPHVSSMYSYHFSMTQTNCPFTEFIILGSRGDKIVPVFGNIFTDEPMPADGRMRLSDKPGWGLTLNRKALNLKRLFGA